MAKRNYIRVESWWGGLYGNYGEINGIRAQARTGVTKDHFDPYGPTPKRITASDGEHVAMVQSFGNETAPHAFAVWAALGKHGTAATLREAKTRADAVLRKAGLIK